jgi:hypothetical protein
MRCDALDNIRGYNCTSTYHLPRRCVASRSEPTRRIGLRPGEGGVPVKLLARLQGSYWAVLCSLDLDLRVDREHRQYFPVTDHGVKNSASETKQCTCSIMPNGEERAGLAIALFPGKCLKQSARCGKRRLTKSISVWAPTQSCRRHLKQIWMPGIWVSVHRLAKDRCQEMATQCIAKQ